MPTPTVPVRAAAFARKLPAPPRTADWCAGARWPPPAILPSGMRVRIAAKKLRYVAEFFATALDARKRARTIVDALAALQDVLGRGNDAVTAARLAR